jgi:hypothetical protein
VLLLPPNYLYGQQHTLSGRIVDDETSQPIEFASILLTETGLWAISDEKGKFTIKQAPSGKSTLTVQCLGYQKIVLSLNVVSDLNNIEFRLKEDNLKLDEVTVVAKRKTDEATTSYVIDRTTLDNQQIINVSDITSLLPGGKTANPTLMSDPRISLRSSGSEKGNASFGTAIDIDGMRLDNNSTMGETLSASTRTVSSSNIESVEIITGIPSVEYGDLSNGVVKVSTRKGKSPFIIEGKLNQHTRQIAVNKGFDLNGHAGVLNMSLEHARSFSDAASPYTAYKRNILSLHYMNTYMQKSTPLTLNIGFTGNLGGYDSKADPDEELDDYNKVRDNAMRAHFDLHWLLNKKWLTNLSMNGSLSYSDRKTESYTSQSSASTQPYIHSMNEGYFIAQEYDERPDADIILGPTGYWYVKGFNDSRPLSWSLKAKATHTHRFGIVINTLMSGAEYSGSHNKGHGTYYDDMRYAPTWREYSYDALPTMHNVALYAEDKAVVPLLKHSSLELTAGVRDDITMIGGSDYGTVSSVSPRVNGRFVFWRGLPQLWVSDLSIHAGWGKSVKLPSFQVLYPTPAYADRLAFSSTSTSENKSFYAYHTHPTKSLYNPELRWQYTNQTDIGFEATIKGTHINVSAFHHKTFRPYMSTYSYFPMTYKYTPPTSLDGLGIDVENRRYAIDSESGIVTVSDATGVSEPVTLNYRERNTYAINNRYVNGTPVDRYGVEWIIDFARIKALRTQLRLDGNYYEYKGIDDVLYADIPLGVNSTMSGNQLYGYVGYYRGSNVTSASYSANASISNGALRRQANLNATLTTHIPKIRMVVSVRLEYSLRNYSRQLSELPDGTRGIVLADKTDFFGEPYDGSSENHFLALYPEYYSTWNEPDVLIPFAEKFEWARDNDKTLYNDLAKLVVRTNYAYVMNPDKMSHYYSANLSVTKELGDHVSLSFYANNFFNNMKKVHSSQTDLETSLFGSGYIPSFYYGLSMRVKI